MSGKILLHVYYLYIIHIYLYINITSKLTSVKIKYTEAELMHFLFLGSGDSDVHRGFRVLKMGIMEDGM